jgi:hypothetical protein
VDFPFAHLYATRERNRRNGGLDKSWQEALDRLTAVSKKPESD